MIQHLLNAQRFHFAACLLGLSAATLSPASDKIELFADGTLKGWVEEQHDFFKKKHPNANTWSVKEGIVTCDGSLGNCGFLRYDRKLSDFTLQLEYRMSKKCNSGVCLRSPEPYDGAETLPSRIGYEVQILDDAGLPPSKTSSGAFYGKLAPLKNTAKQAGEWNTLEIIADGPKIKVTLNGEVVQDVDQTTVDAIKDRPREGYLALQNHGHRTEFRNIFLIDRSTK